MLVPPLLDHTGIAAAGPCCRAAGFRRRSDKLLFFQELGALVEKRWEKVYFDSAAFTEIAFNALEESPPSEHTTYLQVVQGVLEAGSLPPQNLQSHFGQPPLTLYKHDLFAIDALFWLDAPTQIHEHSFSGAFHMLEGSSLHCCYEFALSERRSSRFLIGDVSLRSVEFLTKGDTRGILPGAQFRHSTFHLEKPTVTIVIRTATDEHAGPQYTYLKPSIACDPFARSALLTRQLELLALLRAVSPSEYRLELRDLLATASLEAAFWLLDQAHRYVEESELTPMLDRAVKRHGNVISSFRAVFNENRRMEAINSLCRLLDKREHRLLLALLLGLPSRDAIFRFLRRHYDADPAGLIMQWLAEMTAAEKQDNEQNALGLRLDELSLFIFRCLLDDLSFTEVRAQLREKFDPASVESQADDLRELFSALHRSVLFQPLWARGDASQFQISGARWRADSPDRA